MDDITLSAGDSIKVPIYLTTYNFDARDIQIFVKWPGKGIRPRILKSGKYGASLMANHERFGTWHNEETGQDEPAYTVVTNYVKEEKESRFLAYTPHGCHLTSREGVIAYLTVIAEEDFTGETELQFSYLMATDDDAVGYRDTARMATPVKVTAAKPAFDWNKVELMSYGIPSSGRVGEPIHATASVKNGNDKAIAANTYTAKLHIYDAEMQEDATAEATEIAANSTNGYSFDWTPQAAGTYYAYVQFGFGENAEYRLIQSVPEQIVVKTAPSGVNDVNAGKTVESIRYYNAMGVESAAPFEGLNIVVTNYTDGSKATSKVVK